MQFSRYYYTHNLFNNQEIFVNINRTGSTNFHFKIKNKREIESSGFLQIYRAVIVQNQSSRTRICP